MDLRQPKPTRLRWYEIAPYAAAFLAGFALALMLLLSIETVVGHKVLPPWGMPVTLLGAVAAGQWGQRLPRRMLVAALVVFWLIDFWLLAHAA
jgi:hypothetical protein